MRENLTGKRPIILLGLIYILSLGLLLADKDACIRAVGSFDVITGSDPSVILSYAVLYAEMLLILLAIIYLWIAPGLFLTLAFLAPRGITDWMGKGFVAAFIVQFLGVTIGKVVAGFPFGRQAFFVSIVTPALITWLLLLYRSRQERLVWPISSGLDLRRALLTILIPTCGLLFLLPFIFWQDFNPDGVEAFVVGESLSGAFFPRMPTSSAVMSIGTGIIAPAYPFHFFVMFLGPIEAAIRLPFLLFLPFIFCLLIELIEWQMSRRLDLVHELLIVLALAIYSVVLVFNASYDSYIADMAAPAAEDTLLILAFLGLLYSLGNRYMLPLLGYAVIGSFTRPTMFMLLVFLAAAISIVMRRFRREWLYMLCMAFAVSIVFAMLYGVFYVPAAKESADAAGVNDLLQRMRYITIFDWQRFAYLIVPCGIVPAAALLLFKQQDSFSRIITIVSALYFLFFYFTAFIALHHFIPVMILPLIVFWRTYLNSTLSLGPTRLVLAATLVTGCLSLWLSLPKHFVIQRAAHSIGSRTAFLHGNPSDELRRVNEESAVLDNIAYSFDWFVDPAEEYFTSGLSIIYYSDRSGPINAGHNYIVLPDDAAQPDGTTLVNQVAGAKLYVRSIQAANQDKYQKSDTHYRSSIYDISRETLFAYQGIRKKNYDIDVLQMLRNVKHRVY